MSWVDTIAERSAQGVAMRGSFRGVPFVVPAGQLNFGRRPVIYELPLRDRPQADDLGRKAREYHIYAFVDGTLGGDFLQARDALIKAIEQDGPGTLVHPWYGRLRVVILRAGVRDESRSGGRAVFSIAFVEVDEAPSYPTASVVTSSQVQTAADTAVAAAQSDFVAHWNPVGLPDIQLTELEARLDRTLTGLEAQVSGVTTAVAAEIRAPINMGSAIVGFVQRIGIDATSALQAFGNYELLWDAGSENDALPTTTASRRQQATSDAAAAALVRRTAVIEAARQSSLATYDSSGQALATRDLLLDALDSEMLATDPGTGAPIADDVYQALEALRAAVAEDLQVRGAQLPDLVTYSPPATLPDLVVAHALYGDPTRASEIVSRNGIRNPLFVPGGADLEVLSV